MVSWLCVCLVGFSILFSISLANPINEPLRGETSEHASGKELDKLEVRLKNASVPKYWDPKFETTISFSDSKLKHVDTDMYVYYSRTASVVTFTLNGIVNFHNRTLENDQNMDSNESTLENSLPSVETMLSEMNENKRFGAYDIVAHNESFVARIPNCVPSLWSFDEESTIVTRIKRLSVPVTWHQREWKETDIECVEIKTPKGRSKGSSAAVRTECSVDDSKIEMIPHYTNILLDVLSSGTCVLHLQEPLRSPTPLRTGYQSRPHTPVKLFFYTGIYNTFVLDDVVPSLTAVPKSTQ